MKFNLPENPILFDVGGFKGDWVKIAKETYVNPIVYVFEPVKSFYDRIVDRYKGDQHVKVFNFGLSDVSRCETISIDGDSSSVLLKRGHQETIQLKNIIEFIKEEGIYEVHLIKINIEGEEYRLMEYLVENPELNIFNNYLIQFHRFVDNCESRRNFLRDKLSEYYEELFNYEFVFEGWSMKSLQPIKCLGDSHVSIFSHYDGLVSEGKYHVNGPLSVYRFGPYLAYNLPNKKDVLKLLSSTNVGDNVLLCFGEIDCRAQVKKLSVLNNKSYEDIINDIVYNYFLLIDKFTDRNIILFSVIPELKENPFLNYYESNPNVFDAPKGTLSERQSYKRFFNERIEGESKKRGLKFVTIFDDITINDVGDSKYYMDDIHLSPKKVRYLINRVLIKTGLNK